MAEFSKQWCDINDPERTPDFDIDEIAKTLEPNHYASVICEGFGFLAIGKTPDSEIVLAIPTGGTIVDDDGQIHDSIVWEPYNNLIK
jgi:hypothetical protein